MTRVRVFFGIVFLFVLGVVVPAAYAAPATTDFRVLLDVDNNAATGCTVSGMAGVDQVFVSRIVTDDAAGTGQVTETSRQVCSSGVLGAPVDVTPAGYSAGFHAPSGDVLVETRIPFSAINGGTMPHDIRIGIEATQGVAIHTALTRPDGSIVLFPVAASGKRRSVGAPGAPRVITRDGVGTDWFGIPPMFNGIASGGTQGLRIIRFYGFANDADDFLYFNFTANLSNNAPFAEDDEFTRTAGAALNVPAPGVLANDGDPNGLPLTATPVAPAAHGTVALNPDGSFTYTPDSPDQNKDDAFEYKASNGTKLSNAARVRITVDDGGEGGNQPPVFTSSAAVSVAEGTTGVTTLTATDPDGDTVTFSITGGADQAHFTLAGSALSFASAPDFEAPLDADANNVYVVQVTADDGQGNTVNQTINVTVTNVNETPSFTSGNTFTIDENTTAVGTISASDPDGTAVTYSVSGGADAAQFTINATTGALSFTAAPDFENPADAGADNNYVLQVTATDGTNSVNQTITVTVSNVNEAPSFISTATPAIPENTTAVVTVSASDPEGAAVTYSITGGADMALFSINGATGALTFNAAPNFEAPADAGANNVYNLTVQASDGTNAVTQAITVTVTNVNEPPVITSGAAATIPENTTAVLTVTSTDDDGTAATYSVTGGADQARFTINATTGALAFSVAPNFEAPNDADANNVYIVQVTASDGTNNVNQTITVTVTNVDEAPLFTSIANPSVPENTTAVLTVTTTDEEGQVVTYSLSGGSDQARFTINPATGALSFLVAQNFEAPTDSDTNNTYIVQVTATDGTNPVAQLITVTVTNVNEAPVITSLNAATVAENTTAVLTVTTTDEEGNTITYSITGGADAGDFAINASTGALTFNPAPNFEAPADADANNVYVVQVTANDGTNNTNQTITVTVTNVNEAPVITSSAAASVVENNTAVTTVTTTEPEGQVVTYSLSGGSDIGDFSINAATGALTFNVAPNFEAPADSDTNNVYLVQVTASDGTNNTNQLITVTVTNVNEAPVITSGAAPTIPENTLVATTVTTTDQEGDAITFSITGGADQALFSINATTGVLSFNAAPNFETPTDADTNNQYVVQVTVTDGTSNVSQTITVTVTDVNEAPVFTSSATPSVVEGNTAVTTVTTTDEEGNTVTYSITGGADQALFSINATTGALTFNAAPDFEAPADADTNNTYIVQVTANDGTNNSNQTITVTVTNLNEAPVITSTNAPSVPENTTAVVTVTTTDQEGDTITFSITGGADQALFSINATTGALTFNAARNFEAPADADTNNSYIVQVTANDGTNNTNQTITVAVTDVNEAPSITSPNTALVAENTTAVHTVTSTDPEGNTVTYSITGGADAADFSINATTGALTFNSAPDFEAPADADTNNTYIVQVTANDGTNNTNQTITVTVTDVNEAPSFTSSATPSVAENTTAVLTVTTSDPEGNTITYSITGGADQALFSINATTGALTFNAAPNFEAPADADTNNTYIVQVTANDGTNNTAQTITVTVTDTNEAPSITSSNTASVVENTTAVTTVTTTDPEGNTITYSITGGADQALFSINASTGALTFNTGRDFENPTDADTNNDYIVQVTANDGTNNTNQTITVTVTDANEAPSFTSGATPSVAENTTAVTTVTATDPEGNALTFSITGGADQALFSINASTGALTFNTGRDFENPTDADTNNTYLVDVTVTDGTNPVVQSLTVTVTNTNEAPSITSSNTASTAENTTAVLTVTTTDPEGDTITYSISGGADQALFSINSSTGVLMFAAAPNFEAPADADTNNQYIVQVTATDGTTPVNQTITVTVTDVNEAPSFTSSATPSVPENTTAVTTVTATDPEGNALTFSITGGADQALFSINGTTGALTFNAAPDFEAPADADTNNQYLVQVTVTDGTNPVAQSLTVTVTNANEAPSITSSNTASVAENTTAVLTVTTTDPESDTITYSITGGADATDFNINSSTGALTFAVAPDFEAPADADTNNQYIVQVTATDGTTPVNQTITVTVTNVDEQPVFSSSASPSVPENTTAVVTVQATDPEGAVPTYSITGGADQALFTINGTTGALSFLAAPDFENPGDADTNNVYVVQVTASDSNPATQTINVTVTDANDPPFFTSSATPSIPENTTAAADVDATDPEAQPVTYSITGGADMSDFTINGTTGVLTFNVAPNFEAPHDADTNNIYFVDVTATDGTNPVVQSLTVTVTNVNEPPTITSSNSASVAENSTAVLTVTTTDPEGQTITYSITGGADQGDFSINSSTGALTFSPAPDFEAPADADTNNVYVVQVTASDGTNPVNQTITVTVTNINEAPAFTSSASPSVPENSTAVIDVDATDPEGAGVTYSITGGADQAQFSIVGATGVLTFVSAPDFEAPTDSDTNNIYLVDVTATDGTNPMVQSLTVTVTNVNEPPSFTSSSTPSVAENTTAVVTVTAVDPDGTAPTYSITGGADQALFTINGTTGALTFNAAPDFEAPADADTNNVYLVQVTATDGANPVVQSLTVTVTNVDEAPVITSSNSASVPENTAISTTVVDVDATDPEGASVTYSISGGADSADFNINTSSGVLTFAVMPNFEAPADADTNNIYIVQVTATDGTNPVNQTITVTVTNVNEAPSNTLQDNTVSTNEDVNLIFSNGNANQITVSDPDGDVNVQVTLTATNGTLSTNGTAGLTFTPPGAGNDGTDDTTMTFTGTASTITTRLNGLTYKPNLNYYGAATVTILTNDQGNSGTGGALSSNGGVPDSIAITINPVNDPPTAPDYTVANGNAHITHSGIGITISAADSNELKEDASDVDDHDPYSELTVQIVPGTLSPTNATLTLIDASTGAFYFEPPGGLSGSAAASFQYQVCDNGDVGLGLAAQCSSAKNVQFTITGTDTWFVDDTDAAGCGVTCNGARTKPLVGLNHATLAGRGTGDKVFAFSGTYNHGFTMAASELLVGQASTGTFDAVLGVVVPSNGTIDTRPSLSGAAVTLQNTLTAANSTTVRGFTLSTGANKAYVANANTLTVLETSATAANTAVEITNGTTSNVSFTSTTSTGGTHGINLTNVSGTFAFGTGGLTNNTTAGFALAQNAVNVANITFSGNINTTAAGRPIDIGTAVANSGMRGGTIGLSGNIGNTSANSAGIRVRNSTAGTLNLTGATYALTTGASHAVELTTNPGATINFNPGTSITINTTTGRGFLGSGGGTINVTGSNNTITTTNGGAFEVFGTALVHMGGGYEWKSITATNGTDGISLQFHDGAFTVTGDGPDGDTLPDSVTAGGTITGSDQRGAEFIDVDGPVSLNGMTFTNPADTAGPDATVAAGTCGSLGSGGSNTGCFAGIHFDTVSNVTVRTVNVSGSGQMGINGNAITNLTMNTVNVSNCGTSAQEDGIRLYNLAGATGGMTSVSVNTPFGMGLKLQNSTATLASSGSPFTITNSNFQNSQDAQGAVLHVVGSGAAHVKFVNGTVSGNFSTGIQTATDAAITGTLGVYVDNTSFSNNANAVIVQGSGGTTQFDIRNIDHVARATGSTHGIVIKTDNSGTATGSIHSNLIGNATVGSGAACGGGCNGINADARHTSSLTVDIRGNTIRHVDQNGIGFRGGEGSSKLNITITGNLIMDPDGATLAGIFGDSGVLSSDTNCVAAQIGGTTAWPGAVSATVGEIQNRIEGAWGTSGVRVRKLFGGGAPPEPVFHLPGYDGSGVNNWIQTRNSFSGVATPVTNNTGAGGAFTGGASCP